MKIGLIGLGFMGVMHLRALENVNGLELGALCNPSGRRLDGDFSGIAGNIGGDAGLKIDMTGVGAYRDYEELLKSDVDIIDICTPTYTHKELVLRALEAGKNVICEKPLCRDSASAEEIRDAASGSNVQVMPAMCLRFWPEWAYAKRLKEEGHYGKVKAARFRRVAEPPAWGQGTYFDGAKSGGGLFDLHVHDTDFVQFMFGKPRLVFSQGYSKFSGAIDHVLTQYAVDGGAAVSAEGSWTMTSGFGFNMAYTIQFEHATLDYDFGRSENPLTLYLEGGEKHHVQLSGPDGYARELQYAADIFGSGKKLETVCIDDGVNAVHICEAEEKSVKTGQLVEVR